MRSLMLCCQRILKLFYANLCLQVSDLGNLLGLYAEWHSRLLPYFSFDQFVHQVEQTGTKNRVKVKEFSFLPLQFVIRRADAVISWFPVWYFL